MQIGVFAEPSNIQINLENKNIILTGATGGIGFSIVDTLISLKARVIVSGTNEKKLEELNLNIIQLIPNTISKFRAYKIRDKV